VGITVDGNSITIDNATITLNNAFDQTTGAATITITPAGGVGSLPGILEGQPGLPPTLRNVNFTQVPYGTNPPNPAASWTLIYPGGPGVAAVYDLNLWLNAGPPGNAGSYAIASSTDLSGTATNNTTLVWNALLDQFEYQPLYLGATYWPSTINSTSGFTAQGTPRTLCQISVPALPFAYYPVPIGQTVVTGTINTQIEVSANIGSVSGNQVGVGYGVVGLANQTVALQASIPAGSSGTYGQVAANSAATIVFSATQVANTTDNWATTASTTSFQMTINPVPPS
jgi:hypothetical protein